MVKRQEPSAAVRSQDDSQPGRGTATSALTETLLKEQATALIEFLAAGGIDLKRTNALEAIARIHGAKNWNTLQGSIQAAQKRAGTSGTALDGSQPSMSYAVVTQFADGASVTLSPTKDVALRDFIQTSRIMVDLMREAGEVNFIGQDIDSGLPMLALCIDGSVYVELLHPSTADMMEVAKDKKGSLQLRPMRRVNLNGLESASFQQIGMAMQASFASIDGDQKEDRFKKALMSRQAHRMTIDSIACMEDLSFRCSRSSPQHMFDPSELMSALDRVRVMHSFQAIVSGADGAEIGSD